MFLVLLSLAACEGSYTFTDTTGDTPATDTPVDTAVEEDWSEFDGARLVLVSPLSGSFLPYEEESTFEAEVQDADGNRLDFDDIGWTSDIDDGWSLLGSEVDDDGLDVGTHAITALAELPNGDRLAYTVGGILVQSAYTGIYTGTLQVDTSGDYNGTTYSAGCSGAVTIVVDAYGETAEGDAGCLLSLLGYELDTSYVFDLENDEGDVSGSAALDLSFYQLDIDASGDLSEDGDLTITFADDVYGFVQLDGEVDATRVSRDISDYE